MKERMTQKDREKIQAEIDHRETGAPSPDSGFSERGAGPG